MASDKTLAEVLQLLTKVSDKLSTKIESVDKITRTKSKSDKPGTQKNDKPDFNSKTMANIEKLLMKQEKVQNNPEQVVEEEKPVVITEFGRKAEDSLRRAMKGYAPQPAQAPKEAPKEEGGLISKLGKILPLALLALGGLGGFLSSLMSGKFGELFKLIKAGKLGEAFDKAKEIIYQTISPFLYSIPIIGPIFSFKDGIEEFNKGNLVGGIKNMVQGILGLLPLPYPVKSAIMGGVELLGTWLEGKFGKETIPKGSGGDIMAGALTAIGFVLKPLVKKLPIVGSLINFYEAYQAFKAGGAAGITKGIINLGAGIANLFPGVGTAIAIGLDVISAFVFKETEEKDATGKTVKKISTRDWFNKTLDFITNRYPIKNWIDIGKGLYNVATGNFKEGIVQLAYSIPGFGILASLFGAPETSEKANEATKDMSMTDFFTTIYNSICKSIVMRLPAKFGIRWAAAKLLGVDIGNEQSPEDKIPSDLGVPGDKNAPISETDRLKQIADNANKEKTKKTNDFIKTKEGQIIEPSKDDTIMGLKKGGPLDDMLKSNNDLLKQSNGSLEDLTEVTSNYLSKQVELMTTSNKILLSIKNSMDNFKGGGNIVANSVRTESSTPLYSLRGIQHRSLEVG